MGFQLPVPFVCGSRMQWAAPSRKRRLTGARAVGCRHPAHLVLGQDSIRPARLFGFTAPGLFLFASAPGLLPVCRRERLLFRSRCHRFDGVRSQPSGPARSTREPERGRERTTTAPKRTWLPPNPCGGAFLLLTIGTAVEPGWAFHPAGWHRSDADHPAGVASQHKGAAPPPFKERWTGCLPGRPAPPVGGAISVVFADRRKAASKKESSRATAREKRSRGTDLRYPSP